MSCCYLYCAVGVPADTIVHLLTSLLFLASLVLQLAGLPSAVDVRDVHIVSAVVANALVVSSHAAVAGVPAEYCCLLY
jgi:hypothetical protein